MTDQGEIKLGDTVRDVVTGFEGVAVARYSFLYGCERLSIERSDKDGKPEECVFDEQRLAITQINTVAPPALRSIGGPRKIAAPRHREP